MNRVVVVGGGNAALCAAIAARGAGARVLLLEKAPEPERGGNSFFTAGAFRFAHQGLDDLRRDVLTDLSEAEACAIDIDAYPEAHFFDDLARLTENLTDADLADTLVRRSRPTIVWMRAQGLRFIPMFGRQAYRLGDRHRFWGGLAVEAVGGGPGLVEALYRRAEQLGVEVRYGVKAAGLRLDRRGAIRALATRDADGFHEVACRGVVLACGGFEANPEWRARYLGPDWELARVRGTRHNTGDGIRMALEINAQPYGHWSACHAVAWDLNAPPFGELARKLEIDPEGLERTVAAFNQAVQPGEFNPAVLDGKATRGLTPPKSNWALPLDAPPYLGYAVTCGITFTFGGLRVDTRARVLDTEDRVIPGLYGAGELLGGLFYHNYPGGAGLMAGAVFGRLAGESAAADLE